ncbi:membrane-spanning 4-domains subfamily A member 6A-like [Orycteropus afer afer]|uniref:Membrane-spanning 4-domains subfamily A member 6A-like n=1 Tax=Orycteropus afer afer TaxID=1230840 RepID=A0AC54ZDG5_ORYAF|nr:membrane-spanning 4-domains subfamily A member 6A-like [Orycteropus afer afer]
MIPQHMPSESVVVLTPNGFKFPQTEQPTPTNQGQVSLMKHLKTEIKVLGTIQILCGLMVFSLGLILVSCPFSPQFTPVFSTLLKAGYPFTGAFCFIIAGSLSIITEKKSIKPLVQSSLTASILSCLSAVVGLILLLINLLALGHASWQCELDMQVLPTSYYRYHDDMECSMATTILTGLLSIMLIFSVLELCLAVLSTMLWWKTAHSDFPESVLFLPLSSKNTTNLTHDPGYEELLTS